MTIGQLTDTTKINGYVVTWKGTKKRPAFVEITPRANHPLIFWRGGDAIAFFTRNPHWIMKKAQKLLDLKRKKQGTRTTTYTLSRATLLIEEAKT